MPAIEEGLHKSSIKKTKNQASSEPDSGIEVSSRITPNLHKLIALLRLNMSASRYFQELHSAICENTK